MATEAVVPGAGLQIERMPGHWVLAQLGKRVLRPGGLQLTGALLDGLAVGADDTVVEFAPGLGVTARRTLAQRPASYTAVERDPGAASTVRRYLQGPHQRLVQGTAEATGLPDRCASVLYGEALLTMQTRSGKQAIVAEAARLLQPGGRYGMHEIALADETTEAERAELEEALRGAIRVGARPLTGDEWRGLLEAEGLRVVREARAPMALLEPARVVADEGLAGAARFAFNLLRQPEARARVLAMRRTFRRYAHLMEAIVLVAERPAR